MDSGHRTRIFTVRLTPHLRRLGAGREPRPLDVKSRDASRLVTVVHFNNLPLYPLADNGRSPIANEH